MNMLLNDNFSIREASSAFLALLNCSMDDIQGCLLSNILDQGVPLTAIAEFKQAVINGEPYSTVFPFKVADTIAWLSLKFSPSIANSQSSGILIDFHALDEFSILAVKTLFKAIDAEDFSHAGKPH